MTTESNENEQRPSALLGDWFVSTPESEAMLAEEVEALRQNEKGSPSSWLRFDGMTWPNPADPNEVQWRLRYGPQPPSREDVLAAASFMHAYAHLINLPQRERNERVLQIREHATTPEETTR